MRLIHPGQLGSSTWLLWLRTFAIIGQLVTILAVWIWTDLNLPHASLLAFVGLTTATNVLYALWLSKSRTVTTATAGVVAWTLMLLDLVTLTAMLHLSGGANNPFSFFYFVNLAVGGVMLQPIRAWSLTAVAIAGYGFLLRFSDVLDQLGPIEPDTSFGIRTTGLMVAFSTCCSVVTYFVTRTSGELRRRESELLEAQAAEAANRQLEGLTTLAAGAAHELATPLSTIDVVVRELSRHLDGIAKPASVSQDLKLIDGELDRCRQILQRMRSASGDSMTGRWDQTTVGELIDAALEGIRDPHRVDVVDPETDVEDHPLWVPQEAVAQALRNLIHNGLDASSADGRVTLQPCLRDQWLDLIVSDHGSGMTDEVLSRIGDPFFTTKEPGRGIGLGLFLTRNVVSKLGGQLSWDSHPDKGTTATVTLPLNSAGLTGTKDRLRDGAD